MASSSNLSYMNQCNECMYTDFVICDGGSCGPVDYFFNDGWDPQWEGAKKIFWWGRIRQCNVTLTYGKNVALQYGCSILIAE